MSCLEAFILGLIQGLTEFLPVSSSGHIELGKALLGVQIEDNLLFTVVVHIATVLSTIVVFRTEIFKLITDFFSKGNKDSKNYIAKLLLSAIPVLLVGLLLKDKVETLFSGSVIFVGAMLILTGGLLAFSYFRAKGNRTISWLDALVIGLAQAVAVIPGISRSGATIATGMLIGNDKAKLAKFSFLMVIIPILGKMFLEVVGGGLINTSIGITPLVVGFATAFLSGLIACKLMIKLVQKGNLIWFAVYCLVIGIIAIIFG